MNFSFMSFSCPELGFDGMLDVARQYGYDGVEPRISAKHKHGIEFDASEAYRESCRQKAEAKGIRICCVATSCCYADPAKADSMVTDTHRAIDLAGDVGAPLIRVFGGQIGKGLTRQKAVKLVADSLRAVADHAEERGVAVALETHDDWCDPTQVAEIMRRVNRPNVGVNWDIMHPARVAKASMDAAFQALQPWLRHVHFHDGATTSSGGIELKPIGEGEIDHRRAVVLLKKAQYDGFLSGEWISWQPYAQHLPRELAMMKLYEQEVG